MVVPALPVSSSFTSTSKSHAMNHKTIVAITIALSAFLLPLGGWTLLTVSSSTARISVLEEAKDDIKDRLVRIEGKIDALKGNNVQLPEDARKQARQLP
jgi:hypothetical protein